MEAVRCGLGKPVFVLSVGRFGMRDMRIMPFLVVLLRGRELARKIMDKMENIEKEAKICDD